MNKITTLFPGGFKPLTGAHLALAERYAQHPDTDRVILLIGPKDRDGITRDKTIEIFNLFFSSSGPKKYFSLLFTKELQNGSIISL